MKQFLLLHLLLALMYSSLATADEVIITDKQLGTGAPQKSVTPGIQLSPADHVSNGMYHVPQYLPNHPTAGTIWPRVVELECTGSHQLGWQCDGYHWAPSMGRAEYLFVIPRAKVAPVLIEVPVKKKKQ